MNRSGRFLGVLFAGLLAAGAAFANPIIDRFIEQLAQQGFTEFEVTRTWLGRVRIVAEGDGIEREIIINPRTGEILRDYWEWDDENGTYLLNPTNPSNSGSGSSNSGSGSSNSGSGSSSSGSGSDDDHDDDHDDDKDEDSSDHS